MIRYERLWATMEARGMTQYRLIKHYNFSAGQIGRLKKNMHVSTHTLDTLCTILDCCISDIIEYVPEGRPQVQEDVIQDGPAAGTASEEKDAASKSKKSEASKGDKPKKSGKSKKGDKKASKENKEGKKGKDGKKNK
ncbi:MULTISPECIES: helix-turn-helix transcriptional regulator [unclassified Clostridium]|uniref:helix-turn-helix domain-containing protein n=1 Tax=unclassified Clostridium TaxID=2614128 RepID=UPI001105B8EF|nr:MULTISPECIES: helix-turn-helix transcriptional regulator [unclassified Clostridium]